MLTNPSKESDVPNLANLTICRLTTNSRNPVPLLDVDPADAFINCRIGIKFWIFEITPFGRCARLLGIEFSGGLTGPNHPNSWQGAHNHGVRMKRLFEIKGDFPLTKISRDGPM